MQILSVFLNCPAVKVRFSALLLCFLVKVIKMTESDTYLEERNNLLKLERANFTGGTEKLSKKEEQANGVLLPIKLQELELGYKNSSSVLPSRNFLLARKDIENSKVFKFIKKIPKGASLHTHMLAAVSADYVIKSISYQDNIYGCYINNIFKLKVLDNPKADQNCSWKSLKAYRKEQGPEFDEFLRKNLTLDVDSLHQSKEDVWTKFKNTFSTLYDLVCYRPIFKQYIRRLLVELHNDKILYTELRGTFMPLYDLKGTLFDTKDFFEAFIETVNEFKLEFPEFVGVKYIHCIYRGVDNDTLKTGLEELMYFKHFYPDFIAGFDFVGNEEDGKNLVDFHNELLGVSNDLKFFFHAGETTQFGNVDLNLADAILLNCSRIGHGFALAKHPGLLEVARQRDIAVEVSPISNQVLKLVDDIRNHPVTALLSRGYPVVIGNDDPSAWDATGLSYDWYEVFMAMTWEYNGLEVLKRFAKDSLKYSSMNETEKNYATRIWESQWDQFIENSISEPAI